MLNSIEVENLHKSFGEIKAVQGISFNVQQGEIFSLLGPNGAGKTTTISMLATLLHPDEGDARVLGYSIIHDPMKVKSVLGVVPQEIALYEDLSARENLRYLAGLRQALGDSDIDAALDRVGILSRGDLAARSLSAGQKRRLALARLLLSGALLWILDEPVTNLDVAGVGLVEDLVREHVGQGGLALAAAHQRLLDDERFLRRLELSL